LQPRTLAPTADEEQPRPRARRIDFRDPIQKHLLNDFRRRQRIQSITIGINNLRERVPHYRTRLNKARHRGIIKDFAFDDRLNLMLEKTNQTSLARLNVTHLAGQQQRVKNFFAELNWALRQKPN